MSQTESNTVVLYQDEDGITRVDVRFAGEDVWLRRPLLEGTGTISHEQAIAKAEQEFLIYREREMRALESDFDKAIKQLGLFEEKE